MAKVDKIVAAGRTYSVVLLTLTVAVAAVGTTEFGRWRLLGQARAATSEWIVADLIKDDFEFWWQGRQSDGRPITDAYTFSKWLRTGRDQTYSGFGSVCVRSINSPTWSISVHQPQTPPEFCRVPQPKGIPEVPEPPDVRASIPDLLPWTRDVDFSELHKNILGPLPGDGAAIEGARLALNQEYMQTHPEVAERLPALLKNPMSVDNRWLYVGSEMDRAAFQLQEVARAAKIAVAKDSFPPAVYRDVETALTTSTVKVPVIDTEMPTQNALWVLSLLVFLNCLVLQVTLDRLQGEDLAEREEPWLLIDAKPGLSRLLSTTWLAITLAAPVMAPAVVLAGVLLRARAGTTSSAGAGAMGVLLLLLMAAGAWCSTRIYGMLRTAVSKPAMPAAVVISAEALSDGRLADGPQESQGSESASV
jgi:hypothetical protein